MSEEHPPYYGKPVARKEEQEYIQSIVKKFQHKPVGPELVKEVYDTLMMEKHRGHIHIPFKVVLQKDETGHRQDYIEVVLDSKV